MKNKKEEVESIKEKLIEENNEKTSQQIYEDEYSGLTFKIPSKFEIDKVTGGLYYNGEKISANTILITGIINNLDDDTEKLKIQLLKREKIKEGIFSKNSVYGSPINELSSFGIPINLTNYKIIVKYLSDLESENENSIPVIKAVSKLGWRDGHFIPFSRDSNIVVDMDYKLQKWINAYTSKGKLEDWIEDIRPFRKNPIFRFVLATSFAAPLLKLIGHRIFVVYIWGNSRAGKSSALKAGVSVWGNPNELTLTFNTTAVGIERLAGYYNDLPLALDEKQVNKSQSDIERIIYMLSNGISRIRGNKTGGVQPLNTWKTIIIATGEENISKTNSNTGVLTRCLEIEGSPYDYDEEKASSMYSIVDKNYGLAGPRFLELLINEYSQNDYEELKKMYDKVLDNLKQSCSNDILSYITSVSIVSVADKLISKWFFDEENDEEAYQMARTILDNLDNSKDIDIVDKCFEYISSWIIGNHKCFDKYKRTERDYEETDLKMHPENDLENSDSSRKTYGLYNNGVYYVLRYILEDKLNEKGFSYRKIVSEFGKRGYIQTEKNEYGQIISNTIQKKYRGMNTRFFAFPVEMFEKILSEEEFKQAEKDWDAQFRGYKNYEESKKAEEAILKNHDSTELTDKEKRELEEVMELNKKLEEEERN